MSYGPLITALVRAALPEPTPTYADQPPKDWAALPAFVTYQNTGGVPVYFSEGDIPGKRNARIQMNLWVTTPAARARLGSLLLRATAKHPQMEPLTEIRDRYDNTLRLYGAEFDVSVWFDDV